MWNQRNWIALSALFLLCAGRPALSQQDPVPDPHEQNRKLGRGVNIIGYDSIWQSPERARFQERHFRLIREAGFDTVRVNLHPFQFMDGERHQLKDSWLEVLDWAVENATANNLMVILDLHEFHEMADDPVARKPRFLAFWKQISERYRKAPSTVIFEILNEPFGKLTPSLWNQYLKEALSLIRETNPTRTVIVGPGQWNQIRLLGQLELPEEDRNIIATVHYYLPMEFTHQGASWSQHKDLSGVLWRGTESEKEAILADFQIAQKWSEENKRPLLLGEFGAYDKGDMESRVRYTSFVARTAEGLGWSWTYWQFDSDFIVYDIDRDEWVVPIRDALIPPN